MMRRRALPAWVLALVAVGAGCHPDSSRWQAELSSPATSRMTGAWIVEVGSGDRTVTGTVALLLNRVELPTFWRRSPSPLVGVAEIPVDQLGLSGGGRPAVVHARAWVDSIEMTLDPASASSAMRVLGTWHGDTVRGTWVLQSRAGPSRTGRFTMIRGGS